MSSTDDQFSYLRGQLAALEHLVLAMYDAHPNKVAVQAEFLRQTAQNADLDLATTTPEAFLQGFAFRVKHLAENLSIRNFPIE